MTIAALTAWIGENIILVVVVGVALALLAYRRGDVLKRWFSGEGGDPASGDSVLPVQPTRSTVFDKFSISDFLTELSKHPLIQKLDISREAIVRTLFSFWLIKMSDWFRKTSSVTAAQRSTALQALKQLAPLVQVGGDGEDTSDEPVIPTPVPTPVEPVI